MSTAARVARKLVAILRADVQGYSRLLGEDEVTTLRTVASHLDLMRTLVLAGGGAQTAHAHQRCDAGGASSCCAPQCRAEGIVKKVVTNCVVLSCFVCAPFRVFLGAVAACGSSTLNVEEAERKPRVMSVAWGRRE